MRLATLALVVMLCGCAAKQHVRTNQTFEFRGITVTEDGRHICYHAQVRLDAKSGKQYVQCMENK